MKQGRETSSRTIVLLFQNPADRRVLHDVLAERYRVIDGLQPEFGGSLREDWQLIMTDVASARRLGPRLEDLKAGSSRPLVPVLLVLAATEDAAPWLEAGIDDILRMPLKKVDLFLRLKSLELMADQAASSVISSSENVYEAIFNGAGDGILVLDPKSRAILDANQTALEMFGYSQDEIQHHAFDDLILGNEHDHFSELWEKIPNGFTARPELVECSAFDKKGRDFWIGISLITIQIASAPRLLAIVRDMTMRKQLEEQLRQSQKIESVGRLAGGVAHEYNNMLGVIIGYAELAQMKSPVADPLHDNLEQILIAAKRSKDITRQLLAFARKQTISPKLLDLNASLEAMLKMLRQLLGENIELVWLPKEGLWPVEMDPSLLDQILANLCVNARDAITDIGKICIETHKVTLSQEDCDTHPEFRPGDFLLLAVSDSGCGMDKTTLDQIFEPFFTTKPVGKGTGLGLSMVYGAVKQSNGFMQVESEIGKGATFKVYLPRYQGRDAVAEEGLAGEVLNGHGETVLLVEDEPALLKLTQTILRDLGYKVLAAQSPREALSLAQAHSDRLDMLITDVVMPGMNGRELADRLSRDFPRLKCLYMSGYTKNAIAHHGVLDKGIHFIHKPFSRSEFSIKIRSILSPEQ